MFRSSDYSTSSNYTLQQFTHANSIALLFGRLASWHSEQHVVFIVPVCSCNYKY